MGKARSQRTVQHHLAEDRALLDVPMRPEGGMCDFCKRSCSELYPHTRFLGRGLYQKRLELRVCFSEGCVSYDF